MFNSWRHTQSIVSEEHDVFIVYGALSQYRYRARRRNFQADLKLSPRQVSASSCDFF